MGFNIFCFALALISSDIRLIFSEQVPTSISTVSFNALNEHPDDQNTNIPVNASIEALVNSTIEDNRETLADLSLKLWNKPEINYQETFAHTLLTDFLEQQGFNVERNYVIPTAFRAVFTNTKDKDATTIAVLCEYDALPGIGHACGHNLIAESGVAVGMAVKTVLEKYRNVKGKIVIMGTPAEESGGGKLRLIDGGAFKDIDLSIMVHPSSKDIPAPELTTSYPIDVVFNGKASHAAADPTSGKNALDAAVSCYVSLALSRQQMKPDWRVNVILTGGSVVPNVISDQAGLKLVVRAISPSDISILKDRVLHCCTAAAIATECGINFTFHDESFYDTVKHNSVIRNRFVIHSERAGIVFAQNPEPLSASTDFGNVSHIIPGLHPTFSIGTDAVPHTKEFAIATKDPVAQPYVLRISKVVASTVLDFFQYPYLLRQAQESFAKQK